MIVKRPRYPDLDQYPYLAFDTETTGLQYLKDRMFGFSIALPDGFSAYYDIRQEPDAVNFLLAICRFKKRIICHNASFDYRMAYTSGFMLPLHLLDDTRIRAPLIDEHFLDYSLDALAMEWLGEGKVSDIYEELARMFGGRATRKAQMANLHRAPAEMVSKYAAKDALLTLRLWEAQEEEIAKQDTVDMSLPLSDVINFERRVMPTIIEMEMEGVRVDINAAKDAQERLTVLIDQAQAELNRTVGWKVNVNSTPQVREIFNPTRDDLGNWTIGDIGISPTPSGAPSVGADTLRVIPDRRAELILEIRSMVKTRDTFLGKHVIEHAIDGRVYPTINQIKSDTGGTYTGRLSYVDPALQQIPSRDKKTAQIVKTAFLPDEGQQWMDTDMNSFEVRVFASLVSKYDSRIADVYRKDPRTDFHRMVAEMTNLPRSATYAGEPNAKQLNLSMIFNAGNGLTAERMGKPWEWAEFELDSGEVIRYRKAGQEAMEIINHYHEKLPGVKRLMNKARQVASTRGFVYTFRGRRIRFPGAKFSHKASGLLIQSTAAEYNKENIVVIARVAESFGGRLILNTHDSYSISIPMGMGKEVWDAMRPEIERSGRAGVPLLLDFKGIGNNWWESIINTSGEKI